MSIRNNFRVLVWSLLLFAILILVLDILLNGYWDTVDFNKFPKGLLAAGILYLLMLGGFIVFAVVGENKHSIYLPFTNYLEQLYQSNKKITLWFSTLGVCLLTILIGVVYFEQPLPENETLRLFFYIYGWFHAFFYLTGIGLLSVIIFIVIDCKSYRSTQHAANFGDSFALVQVFLIIIAQLMMTIMIVFMIMSLILIGLNLPFKTVIKGWFFNLRDTYSALPVIKLLLTFSALFFAVIAIIRVEMKQSLRVILLVVMGIVLQFTFPLFETGSLARIEYQVTNFGSGKYLDVTCSYQNLGDVLPDYEMVSRNNKWLVTKPPGYLAPYFGLKSIAGIFSPGIYESKSICRDVISKTLVYFGPFISMLALIPLYLLSRYHYSPQKRHLPILVFILLPNYILFTSIADQLFISTPFLLFVLASWIMVEKRSTLWAGIVGVGYYLCVSYSVSLIGILSIPFLMLGMKFLQDKKVETFKRLVLLGMIVFGTVVLIEAAVRLVSEYNTLEIINRALLSHSNQINLQAKRSKQFLNLLVSNLEYFLFVGPPTVILFLLGILFKTESDQPKRDMSKINFVVTFVLFYLLLNVAGQNKGETARLWLFLNPMLALTAPIFLQDLNEKKQMWLLGLFVFLQLSLMFLFNHTFLDLFQNGIDVL